MASGVIRGLKKNSRALVMFLLGIFVGGGFMLFLYAKKIDSLYRERDAIYYANNQKHKEIMKLHEELANMTEKGTYRQKENEKIKKIQVEVDSERAVGAEAIKAKVEEMMEPFLEKSMEWMSSNPDLVALVLEKQPIPIDEEEKVKFQIHVKYLSFYRSNLKIWVKAEEISDEGVSDSDK
ncbi:hypothetical protein ACFO25_00135 [Paenactinomyces guangxiensis]|uniref:Sporulation membrane protein YtrI C-terminal domain-containing protein n=1 Tax=Paenactinomyces guangxiensis TaxID=1490290 RepID=A0A7W2A862_9BACL|nr:hypothetical protein [Paenactinomyces guangxiensis]MBA4495271.1 hypothetical protein [Paenactinomyces guangxiensis]MBH8592355.1 hypothetical protein [Paenactinomyces guangxiensis]